MIKILQRLLLVNYIVVENDEKRRKRFFVPKSNFSALKRAGLLGQLTVWSKLKRPSKWTYSVVISYFGRISDPWHIRDPIPNQRQFFRSKNVSSSSGSLTQGWGLSHSYGVILSKKYPQINQCISYSIINYRHQKSLVLNKIRNFIQ